VVGGGGSRRGGEAVEWGCHGGWWWWRNKKGLRVVWHQIKCRCLLRLVWEGACENDIYKMMVLCLINTVWLSGNIVSVGHVIYVKAMVQSLLLHFFLLLI